MGRGEQKDLNKNAEIGRGISADQQSKANSVYSTLAPTLTHEATNPSGFAPSDLSAMRTASMQSLGGSTAGLTGQGDLLAARTRNAGAPQAAISEAGRQAMRQDSQNAVEIEGQNALQREKQRQQGVQGLQGLYGGLDAASLNALGLSTQAFTSAANPNNQPFTTAFTSKMGAGLASNLLSAASAVGGG